VGDLAARGEVVKLARELDVPVASLQFLQHQPAGDLAAFRRAITAAIVANEDLRLRRVAAASRLVPKRVAARLAESQLGALLSARVAGVLDVPEALRLAGAVRPGFLADMAAYLDPARTAALVKAIPDVGRRLLDAASYITLGRLISLVDDGPLLALLGYARDDQLLEIALLAEDRVRLDEILAGLSNERAAGVIAVAAGSGQFDQALSLLSSLSPDQKLRLATIAADLGPDVTDGLVRAVIRSGAWDEMLPLLTRMPDATRRAFVNVPATLDPAVIGDVLHHARILGLGTFVLPLLTSLDGAHLATVGEAKVAEDPEVRQWLSESTGMAPAVVDAVLAALRVARSTATPPPTPARSTAAMRANARRPVRSARTAAQRRRSEHQRDDKTAGHDGHIA